EDERDPPAPGEHPHERRDHADHRGATDLRRRARDRGDEVLGQPAAVWRRAARDHAFRRRRHDAQREQRNERDEQADGGRHVASASSYSSRISPNSSSSRSSIVTSPAMPPYSSTTSARWTFRRRSSRKTSPARMPSGTKTGGRTKGSRRKQGACTSRPSRSFA